MNRFSRDLMQALREAAAFAGAAVKRVSTAHAHAVGIAPEPRRPRDQSPAAIARRRAGIERIVRKIASMPILDRRSPREIMDALNDI